MNGETNLARLLKTMSPKLIEGEFVFLSFANAVYGDHAHLKPIASMLESEGLSLVVNKHSADQAGLSYQGVYKGISLDVHSSLDAVGLTAAFSSELGKAGISANVIAGFYHDHIFVKDSDADKALFVLEGISDRKR